MKKRILFWVFLFGVFATPALFAQTSDANDASEYFDWGTEDTYSEVEAAEEEYLREIEAAQEKQMREAEEREARLKKEREEARKESEKKKKVQQSIKKAERLAADEDYAEAAEKYQDLLENEDLSDRQYEEVLDAYRNMNFDWLFSKTPSKTSVIHTVKRGDSLYVIARKYDTTVGLIKKMNGLKKDVIYPDQELKIEKGEFTVIVDKSEHTLLLLLEGEPVKEYVVATGKDESTPEGTFKITDKLKNPTWYRSGAIIEPDSPENGLGTRWLGFDLKGYGIHGTIEPETLGTSASLGCVRMLNSEVEELYDILPSGAKVKVRK